MPPPVGVGEALTAAAALVTLAPAPVAEVVTSTAAIRASSATRRHQRHPAEDLRLVSAAGTRKLVARQPDRRRSNKVWIASA
jgi:hypothetical protein